MSDNHSPHQKLSPDILGAIFERCAAIEEFYEPLDTLLLVCRAFRDAALGHRAIWGHINVEIGHRSTFKACLSRVKSRLHRSGPFVPLDIHIEVVPDKYTENLPRSCRDHARSPYCCHTDASDVACKLLRVLAGRNGELCKRWRSIKIHDLSGLSGPMIQRRDSFDALSYPTPSLVSIDLEEFHLSGSPFPSCPSLQQASFCDISGMSQISLNNVRTIKLVWGQWAESLHDTGMMNLSNLGSAHNLRELHIKSIIGVTIQFPRSIPGLSHLYLEGSRLPDGLSNVRLQGLKFLSLKLGKSAAIEKLKKFRGIPFVGLESIEIAWHEPPATDGPRLRDKTLELISLMTNLRVLHVDDFALSVILKSIWTAKKTLEESEAVSEGQTKGPANSVQPAPPFFGREVRLESIEGAGEATLKEGDTAETVMRIAWKKGVYPPNTPWKHIFNEYGSHEDTDDDLGLGNKTGKRVFVDPKDDSQVATGWY